MQKRTDETERGVFQGDREWSAGSEQKRERKGNRTVRVGGWSREGRKVLLELNDWRFSTITDVFNWYNVCCSCDVYSVTCVRSVLPIDLDLTNSPSKGLLHITFHNIDSTICVISFPILYHPRWNYAICILPYSPRIATLTLILNRLIITILLSMHKSRRVVFSKEEKQATPVDAISHDK